WHPLAAGGDAAGCGALGRVARRRGATPIQVAIAWLLARSRVIVPIPGTSSVAHLDQNVAAARVLLSTADLHELSPTGCFLQRGCRSHWFISAGKHGSEDASRSGTKAVPPTSGADHPIVVSQTM